MPGLPTGESEETFRLAFCGTGPGVSAQGTARVEVGRDSCPPCEAGRFTPNFTSQTCAGCPVGAMAAARVTARAHVCSAGRYSSTSGATACLSCSQGTYAAVEGGLASV